mmetsp:Transcript_62776/g.194775  ORF Transcript_62776/g.194775 Transcript_62776/m.194775 type:complete len:340 (-) Transcript_62776:233-1252(-)
MHPFLRLQACPPVIGPGHRSCAATLEAPLDQVLLEVIANKNYLRETWLSRRPPCSEQWRPVEGRVHRLEGQLPIVPGHSQDAFCPEDLRISEGCEHPTVEGVQVQLAFDADGEAPHPQARWRRAASVRASAVHIEQGPARRPRARPAPDATAEHAAHVDAAIAALQHLGGGVHAPHRAPQPLELRLAASAIELVEQHQGRESDLLLHEPHQRRALPACRGCSAGAQEAAHVRCIHDRDDLAELQPVPQVVVQKERLHHCLGVCEPTALEDNALHTSLQDAPSKDLIPHEVAEVTADLAASAAAIQEEHALAAARGLYDELGVQGGFARLVLDDEQPRRA